MCSNQMCTLILLSYPQPNLKNRNFIVLPVIRSLTLKNQGGEEKVRSLKHMQLRLFPLYPPPLSGFRALSSSRAGQTAPTLALPHLDCSLEFILQLRKLRLGETETTSLRGLHEYPISSLILTDQQGICAVGAQQRRRAHPWMALVLRAMRHHFSSFLWACLCLSSDSIIVLAAPQGQSPCLLSVSWHPLSLGTP